MEIRALAPEDDRSCFQSGDDDLDRFLHKYAGQNQFRHHIGTTYVAAESGRIYGYATVSAGDIEIDELPARSRRGLPRYPLPVLRLARLAVDETARGQGVGRTLLKFVLGLALRMSKGYGCIGVLVDAKPAAVEFYERYGFSEVELVEGQSGARPAPVQLFLSTREIANAAKDR